MKEIITKLENSLKDLINNDYDILEIDINERSITHLLAIYLSYQFIDWNVDCEYNRNHDDPKKLKIERKSIHSDDIKAITVYPDIIVHKRKTNENLLVIELKKDGANKEDCDYDKNKLKAFKDQLNYKYAVFIKIQIGEKPSYSIDWI